MLYGREANQPTEEWMEEVSKGFEPDSYAAKLSEKMRKLWNEIGERVGTTNVEIMNRPRLRKLKFKPYKPNELFYLKQVGKRLYKNINDKEKHKISLKLQNRYTGPHRVLRLINPVVYEADVNGKIKRVHAVNMKPG